MCPHHVQPFLPLIHLFQIYCPLQLEPVQRVTKAICPDKVFGIQKSLFPVHRLDSWSDSLKPPFHVLLSILQISVSHLHVFSHARDGFSASM